MLMLGAPCAQALVCVAARRMYEGAGIGELFSNDALVDEFRHDDVGVFSSFLRMLRQEPNLMLRFFVKMITVR